MDNNSIKNIVLLIPQMRHGGAERVVSRLSFLLNKEFNLKIVVFDDSNLTYDIGCELISLNVPPLTNNNIILKFINIIRRILKYKKYKTKNNIEITYSFGDTANIINILSNGRDKKLISIRGFKRIRTGKNFFERIILKPISIFLCNQADKIVTVSELIKETIIKEYKINPNKIITIHNGYDLNTIRELSKENLNVNENEIFYSNEIIITAGTFRNEKGYWHLLKAFSIVLKNNKKIKLAILGTDYKNNKEKIIDLSKKLGVDKSVYFLGYQKNPYKYFSKSKIYVLSSIFEGFPNALVEAMACGLPVVASDCPSGPREILSPSLGLYEDMKGVKLTEYGILVQKLNVSENYNHKDIEESDILLADGISKILENQLYLNYKYKSLERSNDFDYYTWLVKQKEALSF